MNERFEAAIVAAVTMGALSLSGCDSGSSAKTQSSDHVAPTLESAETLNESTVQLTFSEPMKVQDASHLPGMFGLYAVASEYGLNYTRNCVGGTPTFTCTWADLTYSRQFHSDELDAVISSVEVSAVDAAMVSVRLTGPIDPQANGGTGYLRLTYQPGAGGLTDKAGNALAGIYPTTGIPGNVVHLHGVPAVIHAETVATDLVEFTFSRPLITSDTDAVLQGNFSLRSNSVNPSCVSSVTSIAACYPYYGTVGGMSVHATDPGTLSPAGKVLTFRTLAPIPSSADNGTGYLKFRYSGEATSHALQGDDGLKLADIDINTIPTRRGNVVDTQ